MNDALFTALTRGRIVIIAIARPLPIWPIRYYCEKAEALDVLTRLLDLGSVLSFPANGAAGWITFWR